MSVKIEPKKILLDLGFAPDGRTTKFMTNTVAKHMDKYVPARTLTLASTVDITSNQIIYDKPYADYVYKGERADGTHIITNYRRDKHMYAGPYWDKRCMTTEKDIIIKEIQRYVDRGV